MEVCMEKLLLEDLDLIRESFDDLLSLNRDGKTEEEYETLIDQMNKILKKVHKYSSWENIKTCECGRTTFADLNVETCEIEGVGCMCGKRLNMDYSDDIIEDWNNGKREKY